MRRQTGLELLDAESWKSKLKEASGAAALSQAHVTSVGERFALMKASVTEVKKVAADGERVLEFVISDGSVDRDYDTIRPKGWDLKAYRKNPVVLWAHDSRMLPLGKSLSVKVEEDQLVARAEFCEFELNPMADMVYRMLEGGFLRTASVGFRGLELQPAQDDEERQRRYGIDFLKQELLEWSVVPVPANSNALMRAHEMGINTRPLKSWAEMVLDLKQPLPGVGLNDMERAWEAVRGPSKLYVWIEADASATVADRPPPPAADADPNPADPPAADPVVAPLEVQIDAEAIQRMVREAAEALRKETAGEITFKRTPEGAYLVLRGGEVLATVEHPDDVEWDERGVLRLRSADAGVDYVELEDAPEIPEPVIELEEPEPGEPATASAEDVARAMAEVIRRELATVVPPRA